MKRALVTGCTSGIGQAVMMGLLGDGWEVLGLSRNRPIGVRHPHFDWVGVDLGIPYHLSLYLPNKLVGKPLDALVHCAATYGPVGRFDQTSMSVWSWCIKVNLLGTANLLALVLPFLAESDDGRALLFSGGGAFGARPRYSAYAASKAGVVALMESVAPDILPVTVNCIAPGFVATAIHAATLKAGPEKAGEDEYAKVITETQPFGEEKYRVVDCVRHLLGPDTRGLTGKTISVPHDAWQAITADRVAALCDSDVWTRTRTCAESSLAAV